MAQLYKGLSLSSQMYCSPLSYNTSHYKWLQREDFHISLYFRNMQEIQLDKHVKLLDSPGIVMATGSSDTQIILRNAVKVIIGHKILNIIHISKCTIIH